MRIDWVDEPEESMTHRGKYGWIAGSLILATACLAGAKVVESEGGLTSERARRLVDQVVPRVEHLRGLSFKESVQVEVVDDAAAREYVLARLRKFDQEEHLELVQRVYELRGLIPDGTDLLDLLLEALEEQAGGFYDPSRKSYFLLDDMPVDVAPILTAHELTHALEDQYFDLDRRLTEAMSNDDLAFVRSAVHEGSATLLMTAYTMDAVLKGELDAEALQALAETEAGKAKKLTSLPDVLLRQILGPYVIGAVFLSGGNMLSIAQGFPEEAVNRAINEGPTSSEQLLHPEKFWDSQLRDEPTEVALEDAGKLLGKRWKLGGQGVFGELTLGVLVGAETPLLAGATGVPDAAAWTNAAAAGWDGDRWELWENGGQSVLLLLTVWDSASDATEFAEALATRDDLSWKVAEDRVAVVAGRAGKKVQRLLSRMLR
jgi:hypothetical protein